MLGNLIDALEERNVMLSWYDSIMCHKIAHQTIESYKHKRLESYGY